MNIFLGAQRSMLVAFVCLAYLFLYLPILFLLGFSFNSGAQTFIWGGFTLDWYRDLFSNEEVLHALLNSLIVSVAATALSLFFGVLLVLSIGRQKERIVRLFYTPVLIPEIIIAVSLLSLFSWFSIPLGIPTLIVGHTILALGFVVPIVHTRFLEMDERLIEASLDLGATRYETYKRIVLPIMRPSIITAGLLAFIASFDDFLISFYCTGASSQTLSLYIFSSIRTGISPVINSLSVMLLLAAVLFVVVYAALQSRRED